MSVPAGLQRRIGLPGAIMLGLGSMLGAGVFAVWGPAAAVAGTGPTLLVALAIAAVVASLDALSTAQLAAHLPTSGGAYSFGRELIGPRAGFAAGWMFCVGKSASCAAMALVAAGYLVGPGAPRVALAVGFVVLLTLVNCLGITRTTAAAIVLGSITVAVLLLVVGVGATAPAAPSRGGLELVDAVQAAGLLFFAFAGYARIATLGEEVREPLRTIPRAVVGALSLTILLYVAVALTVLHAVGVAALADSARPLGLVVEAADASWASPVVRVGAAVAALGALLALGAGLGRTALAMARNRDLPGVLATVDSRWSTPVRAEVAVAAVVVVLALSGDVTRVLGLSSFGVLLYYAVANLSAARQDVPGRRLLPRAASLLGLVLCVAIVALLPLASVLAGLAVLLLGLAARELRPAPRDS
ncbi:MAG: APC family permease [Aeromicrobium erythreum]